jgi:8-oxo-dGTP pyrophosphatase MutT (NUDIX family)
MENIVRRGAVAVIPRRRRLLVIRRAAAVEAPGTFCFPGGAIEPGETQQDAICRELREELGVAAIPIRQVWLSTTPWQVELYWWLVHVDPSRPLQPNPAEVAAVQWLTPPQIRQLPQLLTSNHHFLNALARGEVEL